jgi:quinol monooxygenase YgiN
MAEREPATADPVEPLPGTRQRTTFSRRTPTRPRWCAAQITSLPARGERERREKTMVTEALFVRLEAKPGKEEAVERFLKDALPAVQAERDTPAWFAIRMGPSSFAIFDAFPDEAGRQAHLSGQVAAALMKRAPELLAESPRIDKADVLAAKLPH